MFVVSDLLKFCMLSLIIFLISLNFSLSIFVYVVFLRESVKNVTRKTIKEKHEAKVKAAAAKKGKK